MWNCARFGKFSEQSSMTPGGAIQTDRIQFPRHIRNVVSHSCEPSLSARFPRSSFSISSVVGSRFDNSNSEIPIGSLEVPTAYLASTLFLLLHIIRPIVLLSSSLRMRSSAIATYVVILNRLFHKKYRLVRVFLTTVNNYSVMSPWHRK